MSEGGSKSMKWDHEADVVVVGYGGAGAAAVLAASEAGASVIVIEKNPEGGGNTRYSGGSLRTYLDTKKASDYIETLCDGATERDIIETFVVESGRNLEWIKAMGGEIATRPTPQSFPNSLPVAFPSTRGSDGIGPRARVKGAGDDAGIDLWGLLKRRVDDLAIRALYSAPASQLLVDKDAGVTGVVAQHGEQTLRVRAKRGVILTCGGFEYDTQMHINYLGQKYFAMCNPANTGDGIRLAGEVGAELWHMNGVAASLGYKFPEFEFGIRCSMPAGGFMFVDQLGQRFMDETGTDAHLMWSPTSYIDTRTLQRTRIPCYVIFDEDTRMRGPVGVTGQGKVSDVYQWTRDNNAEIKKGWIKAADTIGDLARHINVRPDSLQATIAKYNMQCVGGYDPELGRAPDTLIPLGRPPYYALELWPCLFNTQGGPKRNARAQVINVRGLPIKRLYSAGELGSLWHRNYPGAGNVSEALAFGRIAGRNAAAEIPLG
jgi:succinate dehydrogenase/fumarate reductase flavoprotein subunit